jgi:proteasome lid subunit RPN8/RPN11
MSFSIKALIRAWLASDCRVICSAGRWRGIVGELERRGGHEHEAGAFLLGTEHAGCLEVGDVVFYDDLDPEAYSTGVCVLYGDAFARLWAICREKKLTVVADVHTHPGRAFQSGADKTNPMVARSGHVAIIVPNFAAWPISRNELRVYEYRGQHEWVDQSPPRSRGFFYTGFWS